MASGSTGTGRGGKNSARNLDAAQKGAAAKARAKKAKQGSKAKDPNFLPF